MSVVINTNYSATVAANNLSASNLNLQKSLNRLSSGKKIVNPSDDAGGLAVAMKLSAASVRQGAVSNNVGNALSYLQTQDGALKVAGDVLQRMGELKTLYVDPTKNSSDQANYNSEFTSLQAQLTALAAERFNGINLFGSSGMSIGTTEDGNSAVTAQGANLLGGIPAFPPITDTFANLSQWTNSGPTLAAATGSSLYLPGTHMTVKTNQSLSGAFAINFDYRAETANWGNFLMKLGSTTLFTSTDPTDTNTHHMQITNDGAGHVAWSVDGTAAGSTTIAANTSGQFLFNQAGTNSGYGSYVTNFSAVSTASTSNNVGTVSSAANLGAVNLSTITAALQDVATYRAQNGATQSRLAFSADLLTVNKANLEAANSRITDVDVAHESTSLARYNTLVQAGTAMLSQANSSAQSALRLLS